MKSLELHSLRPVVLRQIACCRFIVGPSSLESLHFFASSLVVHFLNGAAWLWVPYATSPSNSFFSSPLSTPDGITMQQIILFATVRTRELRFPKDDVVPPGGEVVFSGRIDTTDVRSSLRLDSWSHLFFFFCISFPPYFLRSRYRLLVEEDISTKIRAAGISKRP
jgi:hypothetical protein